MIVDELQGVPIDISAELIMELVRVSLLSTILCEIDSPACQALWIRPQQLLQRCVGFVRLHCWIWCHLDRCSVVEAQGEAVNKG